VSGSGEGEVYDSGPSSRVHEEAELDGHCNFVNFHHDEAKNAKGPGKCASDCECDGMRSCLSGKCSGTARPKKLTAETCNSTDYHYQEAWTPAGAGTCSGDCECDGLRKCVLAPHLVDYFAFFDFEGSNAEGGAGALVRMIRAFAGAGIRNRTIAVFDNDTAARAALSSLRNARLPKNLRILRLPPVPLGKRYPTVGPSGRVAANINGRAGSIELYFGEDVLRRGDGTRRCSPRWCSR
jgi:hypothetical protein